MKSIEYNFAIKFVS